MTTNGMFCNSIFRRTPAGGDKDLLAEAASLRAENTGRGDRGETASTHVLPRLRGARTALPVRGVIAAALALFLSGCATSAPPEMKGKWAPVNRFADDPVEIPLNPRYVYQPTPADGTLKSVLSRWAGDLGVELVYQHPSDYTLHSRVAGIRTHDPMEAVSLMARAYADQGVVITLDSKRMTVRREMPSERDEAGMASHEVGRE